jgi:DNA-binding protein H-NS
MANKTLTIVAPEELIDATIEAFAAKGQREDGVTDQDHAIEMMLDLFREEIVQRSSQQANMASRLAQRAADKAAHENLKSQRGSVTVEIV